MYKKIAIITARSGSKGLPDKNILMLGNKPLITYSIEAALKSKCFEKVIVSTDSEEYRTISEEYGAEVIMRGEELSSDAATSYQVLKDVLNKIKIPLDYFVLLQPTSPFRNEIHIKEAVEKFERNIQNFNFLVSMTKSEKPSELIVKIDEDETLKNYNLDFSEYKRQSYKEYYPNGAIFIGKVNEYLEKKHFFGKKSIAYFMSREDSIDIDDKLDFEIAISILNRKNKHKLIKKSILERIREKSSNFKEVKTITLMGHSILDNLAIDRISNKKVNNLGIRGISTKEYNEEIFDKKLIRKIGEIAILMFGTNDIVYKNCTKKEILKEIKKVIENIKLINKNTKIYFVEISNVRNRMDRNNKIINQLNDYLYKNLKNEVNYVFLNFILKDKYGKLKQEYTDDGLHFNDEGNKVFVEILEKEIK